MTAQTCHGLCLCVPIPQRGLMPADYPVIVDQHRRQWQRGTTEPLAPTAPLWRPKVVAS